MIAEWRFWQHQLAIVSNTDDPVLALVSGYGGGKTYTLAHWAVLRALQNPRGCAVLLEGPTWRHGRRVLGRNVQLALESAGVKYALNKADLTFSFAGREIWIASGDHPESLSGLDVACAGIDEPAIQEEEADRRVCTRVRDPRASIRQILYTGTHEGLGWFYKRCQSIPVITVPSYANKSLTVDSVEQLKARFAGDPLRYQMYVEGKAVSISGGVYTCFSRANVATCANPKEGELVVGFDFNVGYMCTPVARVLGDEIHVFAEVISEQTTTEAHGAKVKEFLLSNGLASYTTSSFGGSLTGPSGSRVSAWIDATGGARKTSATRTDAQTLRHLGFYVRHPSCNPPVRERIEVVQQSLNRKTLFLDEARAPVTTMALRDHAYAKGSDPPEPQKRWNSGEVPLDAAADALGYVVWGVRSLTNRRVTVS